MIDFELVVEIPEARERAIVVFTEDSVDLAIERLKACEYDALVGPLLMVAAVSVRIGGRRWRDPINAKMHSQTEVKRAAIAWALDALMEKS